MTFEIINREDIIKQYGESYYNNMSRSVDFALDGRTLKDVCSQFKTSEYYLMPRWNVHDVQEHKECFVFSIIVICNNKLHLEYLWKDGYRGVINHVF